MTHCYSFLDQKSYWKCYSFEVKSNLTVSNMLRMVTQWHHYYYFNFLLPEKKKTLLNEFYCSDTDWHRCVVTMSISQYRHTTYTDNFSLCFNICQNSSFRSSTVLEHLRDKYQRMFPSLLCHLLLFSSCSSVRFSSGSCQQYSHCYQKKVSFRRLLQPNGKFQHILIIPTGHFRTLCALFGLPKRSIIIPITCIACCSLYLISNNCLHRFDYVETVNPLTSKFPTDCCFKRLSFDNRASFTSIS